MSATCEAGRAPASEAAAPGETALRAAIERLAMCWEHPRGTLHPARAAELLRLALAANPAAVPTEPSDFAAGYAAAVRDAARLCREKAEGHRTDANKPHVTNATFTALYFKCETLGEAAAQIEALRPSGEAAASRAPGNGEVADGGV